MTRHGHPSIIGGDFNIEVGIFTEHVDLSTLQLVVKCAPTPSCITQAEDGAIESSTYIDYFL
eukprot:7409097-Pyramimonas_sp.AAC.1